MSKAFQYGILYAYRSVTKPVEGTILSVARGIAKGTREVIRTETDFSKILEASITCGNEALAKTPEQLQILKDANVVDAGGQGLIFFLMGCLNGLTGKVEKIDIEVKPVISRLEAKGEQFSIEYPYCTEFIISPCKLPAKEVRKRLEAWGESMIVAEGDNLIKVHIHAQRPGHVLDMAADWGTLHDIKCDNMIDQFHKNKDKQKVIAKKKLGVLAVVSGNGWKELYEKLHCDVISGGQSMNPSVQEISLGIENGHYEKYIVLPNNKNIIMAANQAAELTEDKDIIVLPTKTIPQGIVALVNYIPDYTAEENKEAMLAELDSVKTGQVTYAVRDTEIDGMQIRQNDYMGIGDKAILAVGTDLKETTMKMIDAMVDEDSAIVSIYYGADETEEHAQEIGKMIEEKYPDVEVEINCGGQPIYYFVISVE